MSTGKRIAKRSILGTRVVAPGIDGRFYPAVIQSPKTYSDSYVSENRYLVRFDNSRKVSEFGESELIGPGFSGVSAVGTLLSGQRVYLTHGGREVEGTVCQHDVKADIVTVNMSVGSILSLICNFLFSSLIISVSRVSFQSVKLMRSDSVNTGD